MRALTFHINICRHHEHPNQTPHEGRDGMCICAAHDPDHAHAARIASEPGNVGQADCRRLFRQPWHRSAKPSRVRRRGNSIVPDSLVAEWRGLPSCPPAQGESSRFVRGVLQQPASMMSRKTRIFTQIDPTFPFARARRRALIVEFSLSVCRCCSPVSKFPVIFTWRLRRPTNFYPLVFSPAQSCMRVALRRP